MLACGDNLACGDDLARHGSALRRAAHPVEDRPQLLEGDAREKQGIDDRPDQKREEDDVEQDVEIGR